MRIENVENLSTGYGWEVEDILRGKSVKVNENSHIDGSSSGMMGAPGMRRLDVECVKAGRTSIRMAYVRPWEWNGFESVNDKNYDTLGNPVHSVELVCLVNDENAKDTNAEL